MQSNNNINNTIRKFEKRKINSAKNSLFKQITANIFTNPIFFDL